MSLIKLSEIDPVQLARATVRDAHDRIIRQAMAIDAHLTPVLYYGGLPTTPRPGWDGMTDPRPEDTTAGSAVVALTRYAQLGVEMDADVHEYCVSLIGIADEALDEVSEGIGADPELELGVVVSAALAREAIDAGKAVSTRRLAILASTAWTTVRNAVAAAELNARPQKDRPSHHEVPAADARRWLGARNVPGYRPKS